VLEDVDLNIETGELVALLGPSGSGKTTLLRIIAGMEIPDPGSGPVLFDGVDISNTAIGARRIGFVFQHYALFKTMSVFENIAFGLRAKPWRQRLPEAGIRTKVEQLLDLVQLQALSRRMPAQLSGGQRQRVALARALAVEPRVLLLDEPFGALDATVRRDLRRWLRRLHETIEVTTIFVTHDQEEALEVSDRVAVMNAGRIEQFASPLDVYEKPASRFVFQFLGHYNLFSARAGAAAGGETLVRPHELVLRREDPDGAGIAARVGHVGLAGPTVRIELRRLDDGQPIDAEMPLDASRDLALQPGDTVFVTLKQQHHFVDDYSI
jgi:sulfate transport system ATP-binding protein